MPFTRGKKHKEAAGNKASKGNTAASENQEEATQVKRTSSPPHGAPKKRTAFIDITNAHKVTISLPGRKRESAKKVQKKTNAASVQSKNRTNLQKSSSVSSEGSPAEKERSDVEENKKSEEPQRDDSSPAEEPADVLSPAAREVPAHIQRQTIPKEFDIDLDNSEDCYMCPEYAKDIFDYLKKREEKFVLSNYMDKQPYLSPDMRAILIDWLVEVQENFELFHETLYLAVKLTDHYLSKVTIHRDLLQLVGSTALLIACKFEERCPPPVEDFLYICDDAYKRHELISIEANILKTLSFDINIPIPYRFLRRYARCVNAGMDTLTLARFFCEMSLMEIDFVLERGSRLASACLLMALVTKNLGGWNKSILDSQTYPKSHCRPNGETFVQPNGGRSRNILNSNSGKIEAYIG
ncbi:G2/mitotic-specific cyclin-B3 isoform X2 [Poeciliopsis prolifica]|uniref:G2/mitotic-specific cyclin-B3 isoform X2 n=1 Tax=Poeciliopsis prolifica TaxID=188132 RepID=UPI002414156D|nr:G2/mitotic-specific cyclin-B3 isoform X2 [Poeciliopsis prolifica]